MAVKVKKPKLSDFGKAKDIWEDPVLLHNAISIQKKLADVFAEAERAGVQIEVHIMNNGRTIEAVGLELPKNHPDEAGNEGWFIFASPDPDLEPEVVL